MPAGRATAERVRFSNDAMSVVACVSALLLRRRSRRLFGKNGPAAGLLVSDVLIRDTMADGINLHGGWANVTVVRGPNKSNLTDRRHLD